MEIFTPCKGIHIHQHVIGGTGFILKYGSQLYLPWLSSQHYLRVLHKVSNNLVKSICVVTDKLYIHTLTNNLHL